MSARIECFAIPAIFAISATDERLTQVYLSRPQLTPVYISDDLEKRTHRAANSASGEWLTQVYAS